MSRFTKYFKDLELQTSRHTMHGAQTMQGNRMTAKEVILAAPAPKKMFRSSRVSPDRELTFPVRRSEFGQSGVRFRAKPLSVPRGVKFESSGLMKSIFQEYASDGVKRNKRYETDLNEKVTSSKMKAEYASESIRQEVQRTRPETQPIRPKPTPEPEPTQQPEPARQPEVPIWEPEAFPADRSAAQTEPQEAISDQFQAQCYSCFGKWMAPVGPLPIITNCPHCRTKNMFKHIPKMAPPPPPQEPIPVEESYVVEPVQEQSTVGLNPQALSMNENGKKMLKDRFYKAAIYWFDQAFQLEPRLEEAKRLRDKAEQAMHGDIDFQEILNEMKKKRGR